MNTRTTGGNIYIENVSWDGLSLQPLKPLFIMPKKLIIADDHRIIFDGLSYLITREKLPYELEYVPDMLALGKRLAEQTFDLMILDIDIPGGNVFKFVESRQHIPAPATPILILSAYGEEQFAPMFIKVGAKGYVDKKDSTDHLLQALQTVLSGQLYISTKLKNYMVDMSVNRLVKETSAIPSVDKLTLKELEVARLLAKGETLPAIAKKLNFNRSSLGVYKTRIFTKLKVNNIIQLAKMLETANKI